MSGAKTSKKLASAKQDAAIKKSFSTCAAPASSTLPCAGPVCKEVCSWSEVTVSEVGSTRKLRIRSNPGAKDVVPSADLRAYDFVFDVIVSAGTRASEVGVSARRVGACTNPSHQDCRWSRPGEYGPFRPNLQSALHKVTTPHAYGGGPEKYEVLVEGCQESSTASRPSFRGLVRAFAPDVWEFDVAIPAVWKSTSERSSTVDADAHTRTKSHEVEIFGVTTREDSTTKVRSLGSGETSKETKKTEWRDGERVEKTRASGTHTVTNARTGASELVRFESHEVKVSKVKPAISSVSGSQSSTTSLAAACTLDDPAAVELKFKGGARVSIKHNGQVAEFAALLAQIANVALEIKKAWATLFDIVPQIGWKTTFEIALLTGTISGTVTREVSPTAENDRYALASRTVDLELDLDIVALSLEASFGIELSSPKGVDFFAGTKVVELIAKASLEIAGKLSIAKRLRGSVFPLEPKSTASATVMILGSFTLYGATYSVGGDVVVAIDLKASITEDIPPFCVRVEATLRPIVAKATVNSPGTGEREVFSAELCKEKTFLKRQIFPETGSW